MGRFCVPCVIGCLLLVQPAHPQTTPSHPQHQHPAAQVASSDEEHVGWVPRELVDRPVGLRDGIGNENDPVTTSSPQAQAFYNQGMAYLHSYVWIEAARSFKQALRLDPKLAMAYVGLSRAYSGLEDLPAALGAAAKAQELAASASPREQRRIALRAKQLEAIADVGNPAKHAAYKKAINDAIAMDPQDPELWLLGGNAEEPTAAGRGQRGGAASIAFYEAALNRSPNNFAAEHYLTHSYENLGRPFDAVKHGEIYARLVPNVGHAQHMYGHDLRLVGRVDDAIAQFNKTDALEQAYYKQENIPASYDWHHIHNLDLLSGSHEAKGQMKSAEELLRQLFALSAVDGFWDAYKADWPRFLISRGRLDEALSASREMIESRFALGRTMGHLLAGRALAAASRLDEARRELKAAEQELQNVAEFDPEPLMPQPRTFPALHMELLRGEIALRSGQKVEAESKFKLVQSQMMPRRSTADAISLLFIIQQMAQEARENDDWDLAEHTARQMLAFDPEYAGGHFAMALVAEHNGAADKMRQEFEMAKKLWASADSDLPELKYMRQKLAAQK